MCNNEAENGRNMREREKKIEKYLLILCLFIILVASLSNPYLSNRQKYILFISIEKKRRERVRERADLGLILKFCLYLRIIEFKL